MKQKKTHWPLLTPGDRLSYALHTLGIKWKDAWAAMGITMDMLAKYCSNKTKISESRLDLLLLKKEVSKKFILNNTGEPLATLQERLDLLHLEKNIFNKIRIDLRTSNIVDILSTASEKELGLFEKLAAKIQKDRKKIKSALKK
ncbi:hypothetical protein LEP1GSC050_2783 [Leptospira broomii serovar Hurstbridge str. 5399]|uniref:Uncharacterized protein n=1 Tax=Leptospira broomii serovar Hurstbridge str. 5399 TaxID=1049789 RepID=T0FDV7_9LEPT|nr:hypothetical protein [Leptospira broomii]EQA46036.1 hypothetical protein LEP1GSC050_2783 [Leptospira broomii serovar Hurstbridge str. 5399]